MSILDGNQQNNVKNDSHIYQLMAEQMQNQMLDMMQKHSESTLSKMHEIAQNSLKQKNSDLETLNKKTNPDDDAVIRKIQRETDAINQQMEEKSLKTEKMFENFMENLRTVQS